jgi:hypothetical protein
MPGIIGNAPISGLAPRAGAFGRNSQNPLRTGRTLYDDRGYQAGNSVIVEDPFERARRGSSNHPLDAHAPAEFVLTRDYRVSENSLLQWVERQPRVSAAPPRSTSADENAWEVLAALIGSVEGPADWASQHDHYLYGSEKRSTNDDDR